MMVTLRKAVMGDMDLLYAWANDPVVRSNSFHSEPIPYETHQAWFRRMMQNDAVRQYILMEDDTPVGQIRLNLDGDEAEIGYSVAKEHRGKGYGRRILQLIAQEVRGELPEVKRLVAKVKPDNVASNRLFESLGYETDYHCYSSSILSEEGTQNHGVSSR